MKRSKIIISIILNTLIVLFTILATVMMFTGYRFMHGYEPILEVGKLEMFKFFTVDSNILVAFSSCILIYYNKMLLNDRIKEIPRLIYLFKYLGTVAVTLTLVIVFIYLGPISKDGIISMLQNSNLFYHFIVPFLSIISFVFFEKSNKLLFHDLFWGMSSVFIYAVFYLLNVLMHIENGSISVEYDWYWFVQYGLWTIPIVLIVIFSLTFVIAFFLWKSNHSINKKKINNVIY